MKPNELYHYGILGMKWGVRRTPEQLGHKTTSSNTRKGFGDTKKEGKKTEPLKSAADISKDLGKVVKVIQQRTSESESKRKAQLRAGQKKKASEMTNEELQELIQRMSLEDQYANLSASRMAVGKSSADELLSGVGEGLAVVGSIFSILLSAKALAGK